MVGIALPTVDTVTEAEANAPLRLETYTLNKYDCCADKVPGERVNDGVLMLPMGQA